MCRPKHGNEKRSDQFPVSDLTCNEIIHNYSFSNKFTSGIIVLTRADLGEHGDAARNSQSGLSYHPATCSGTLVPGLRLASSGYSSYTNSLYWKPAPKAYLFFYVADNKYLAALLACSLQQSGVKTGVS